MGKNILFGLVLIFAAAVMAGCAAQEGMKDESSQRSKQSTTISFSENEANYEAVFEKNKLTELYIDGRKVPEEELDKHKKLVNKKLKEIVKKDYAHFEAFNFDSDKFSKDMEEFKKEMKSKKWEISSRFFDSEEFKKNMEKLNEELSHLKDIDIQIDFDKNELKKELDKVKEDIGKIDLDKIHIEVELQMEKLDEEMKKLKEEMENLDVDLKDMDKELKKLDSFMGVLKSELVADNLIDNIDDNFEMELNSEKMTVNDIPISDELFQKYKKLYEKHMEKELTEKQNFQIH